MSPNFKEVYLSVYGRFPITETPLLLLPEQHGRVACYVGTRATDKVWFNIQMRVSAELVRSEVHTSIREEVYVKA